MAGKDLISGEPAVPYTIPTVERLLVVQPDRATKSVAGRDRMLRDLENDLTRLAHSATCSVERVGLTRESLVRVMFKWLFTVRTIPEVFYKSPPEAVFEDADRVLVIGQGAFGAVPDRFLKSSRVVFDADDDYGIRLKEWRDNRVGFAAGLLGEQHGKLIERVLGSPIGYVVNWIEAFKARLHRRRALEACEYISFTNPEEAAAENSGHLAQFLALPPRFKIRRQTITGATQPRFFFIGTERLAQNRLALRQLVALWRECAFDFPLHIHGDIRERVEAPNVIYHGFIDRIEDAFPADGILLYPAKLGGGLKIKLVESVEWGVPFLSEVKGVSGFGEAARPFVVSGDWESAIRQANTPEGAARLRSQMQKMQDQLHQQFNAERDASLARAFGLKGFSG